MRLLIRQCRWCSYDMDNCGHALEIRRALKHVTAHGTLTHNCPIYPGIIPEGTLVEIELKQILVDEWDNGNGDYGSRFEWESAGRVSGHVMGVTKNRYYIIHLLKPTKLVLPGNNNDIRGAKEVEVEIRLKVLRDLKVIAPPPDNWQAIRAKINGWDDEII